MQVQIDIGFEQLVKLVKALPLAKRKQLKAAIESETKGQGNVTHLKDLLLKGPVASPKQLATIADNRKALNQWRSK
jgi:hypothetical protein